MEYNFLNIAEAEQIYNSYIKNDFPPDEVKPFKSIKRLMEEGGYRVVTFYEKGELIAYMFIFVNEENKTVFVDYYAVIKEKRQQGYGKRAILKLRDIFKDMAYIFLESENIEFSKDNEDRKIRERRISFYNKCTLFDTGVRAKVFGVEYVVLCLVCSRKPQKEEVTKEMTNVYNNFVSQTHRHNVTIY